MNNMTVAELVAVVGRELSSMTINYNDDARVILDSDGVKVELDPSPVEGLPSVKLADRLAEILGMSVQPDYQLAILTYSYWSGYEEARYGRHQNLCFSGVYHPSVVCEGQGVCMWCGCTLMVA